MAATLFAVLALVVAGFHLTLVLGAPWGRLTMGGRWPGVLPMRARVLSAASGVLTLGMAAVLWRAGPGWAVQGVVALMLVSVVANAATGSESERLVWLPVSLAMFLAALSVAL
jgi:hypothetical protein